MIPMVSTLLPSMLMVLPAKGWTTLLYSFGWRRRKRSLTHVLSQPVSHRVGLSSPSKLTMILALYIGLGSGVVLWVVSLSAAGESLEAWAFSSPTKDGPVVSSSVFSFPESPGLWPGRTGQNLPRLPFAFSPSKAQASRPFRRLPSAHGRQGPLQP